MSEDAVARVSNIILAVGLLVSILLVAVLARLLDGWVRVVVLAVLTPLVLLIALILWQGTRAVRLMSERRVWRLAELREKRVIGVLAYPDVGDWQDRLELDFVFPSSPHLLAANPDLIDTPMGQHTMLVLGELIGRPPPLSGVYDLPGRATLALIVEADSGDEVHLWDLSTYFERADAGDDAARENLYELQLYVQQQALRASSTRHSST